MLAVRPDQPEWVVIVASIVAFQIVMAVMAVPRTLGKDEPMMMLATGGDPPAVPVTAGVILAVIVLVFALLMLTFMIPLRNRIVEES